MTDNRTTELREKLTERGVKYQAIGKTLTYWNHDGSDNECDDADFVADERPDGTLTVEGLTPEQAIAATLGSDAKPCYAAEENYKRCKYSTNRGWCDDAPFLVWDDTGRLFVTMGGLKTWDVTDDAKTWFATLGGGECEFRPFKDEDWSEPNAVRGVCSECSALMYGKDKYCPNCGKAVKR